MHVQPFSTKQKRGPLVRGSRSVEVLPTSALNRVTTQFPLMSVLIWIKGGRELSALGFSVGMRAPQESYSARQGTLQ